MSTALSSADHADAEGGAEIDGGNQNQ